MSNTNNSNIIDFTLPTALLYISQTNPVSEEDFKNMRRAQEVIQDSDLSKTEISTLRKKLIAEDKEDKKIIKYQNMKPMQQDMVDNMGKMGIGTKNNKGGVILKKNIEKMAYGGMSGGKKHMYSAGGSVKDNAGLRALKKASPKAYANIKRGS